MAGRPNPVLLKTKIQMKNNKTIAASKHFNCDEINMDCTHKFVQGRASNKNNSHIKDKNQKETEKLRTTSTKMNKKQCHIQI